MTTTSVIEIGDLIEHKEESLTVEKEFIEKVKVLGIMDIEPLLQEDVKIIGRLEKYDFLTLLRDIFIEFKKLGDTQILVDQGSCGICGASEPQTKYTGIRKIQKVLELRGNNSNERFHFAVLNKGQEPLLFRTCYGFVDKNGERVKDEGGLSKMTKFAVDRQAQLSGYRK